MNAEFQNDKIYVAKQKDTMKHKICGWILWNLFVGFSFICGIIINIEFDIFHSRLTSSLLNIFLCYIEIKSYI